MESSQPSDSNVFSVRIVSMDYYMASPITDVDICYSSFQGGKVNEVPVIRIYGSTPAGQKTCLHVHRALPYLYVPCSHLLQTSEEGEIYTRNISSAIEKALKSKQRSSTGSKRQHVHGCSLVRARNFYGFHASEELFVKIYLYYPHEVTRVATLLLDGAVLDRSYQPHESHIPYLLQFLVDYNLYGMGHLHVSKVKFRYPLPDGLIPRVTHQGCASKHAIEKLACTSGNNQADSSTRSSQGLPIWISTTVPSGWIWPPPVATDSDSSPDQDADLVKRQSTCELEGDATVDEIVNQQFKMYSPLSQTRSEVKMVQSLVPIWEEEYERTGTHEEVMYSEPSKPLPEDVLKTLLHGPECEDALMDLFKEAENSSSVQVTPTEEGERFLQSIRSLADVSSSLEMVEHANASCSGGGSSQCSEERIGSVSISEGPLSIHDDDAVPSQSRLKFPEIVPVEEEMASLTNSDPKGIDTEAAGLLRWLASSQAEEELNTDDELGCDLILTPLLPKAGIDKILEKANMDYECESQQECQDILDSVVEPDSLILKEQTLCSTSASHSTHMPSDNIIPQLDGSCDDLVTDSVGHLSERNETTKTVRSSQRLLRTKVGHSSEKRKHHRLWGPLPLSTQQKVGEDSESSSFNSDVSNDKKCTSSSSGKNDDESWDNLRTCANTDDHCVKEQKELSGSSVRDLMRNKRSCRVEPSEVGTCSVKKICLEKKQKAFINPRKLELHVENNDVENLIPKRTPEKPLVMYQAETAQIKGLSSATSARGTCPKTYGFGPAYGEIPVYGKLPLMSCSDGSLDGSRSMNEHSFTHESPSDIEPFGFHCSTRSIPLTDVSLAKEVPESLVLVKQDSAPSTQPEYSEVEKAELFSRCFPSDENSLENYRAGKEPPGTCFDGYKNTDAAAEADVAERKSFSTQLNVQNCSASPSFPTTVTTEGMRAKYTQMSFSKKPPMIDWKNWTSADTSFAPVVHRQTSTNIDNSEVTLGCSSSSLDSEENVAPEIPLFFPNVVQVGEEVSKSNRNNEVTMSSQGTVLGIHTHFKNDGSLLYLLTTKYSPPSVDSVHDWLSHQSSRDATGTTIEKIRSKFPDSPSPSSCKSLDFMKENTPNDGNGAPDPLKLHGASTRDIDQLTEEINRNMKARNPEVTAKIFAEDTVHKGTERTENWQEVSQITGPDLRSKLTPLSQTGFRDSASVGGGQQLTLMSIEVQAECRGDLRPDPRFDAITVIAVSIQDDNDNTLESFVLLRVNECDSNQRNLDAVSGCTVIVVSDEKHLFYHFTKIVRSCDPDILMGWEIQGGSLGFLAERAAQLGIVLLNSISRTPSCEPKVPARDSAPQETGLLDDLLPEPLVTDPTVFEDAIIEDEWGRTHASGVHVGGRIVLNIWRLMRGEVKLNMYTIEAVAEEVLRRKVPLIPPRILTQWFLSGPGQARFRCIEYIMERTKLNLEIMNQLDMINRTSELARVFGIDFFSVLSRGSQYRVESMFLRLAHTQNYLAVSPGNQQVASQPAMECLPLVMEPESRFYPDPVVVLDFQSLYPSMIIAYNLCYCTCLGKVIPAKPNTLGVSSFLADPQLLMDLKHKILLTPNGVMYVPSEVRKGVLPRLLEEILSTRIMVKRAMKKLTPSQRVLHKIFNARQLALKLISNVTYGYTAAGFSGRMPCAELADSIVQCGRRTLENAISFVNSHEKWNAKVIYGDTDSLFVLLKGRTMEESFSIGQEIASVITSMNPKPVTLKMEKVYHPCFLLTKKRYVGYSYENLDQDEPLFDAKGIETVRRDSCAAVAKTLEHSLRLYFEHQDISKVKLYLQRQWTRILSGRVSLQDFVFAKEVRLGTYSSRSSSLPPAAIVASKALKVDPRAEPHYAERIPYVVIHGEPGARLVDMVVNPLDLLAMESPFRLNDLYYINKQIIPALQRVFGLVGADLRQWFLEMPKPVRPSVGKRFSYASNGQRTRIDSYYLSKHCFVCGELVQTSTHLCELCSKNKPAVATVVSSRTSKLERDIQHLAAICRHCGGGDWVVESGVKCVSLACTVFYERRKVQKELQAHSAVATDLGFYPRCRAEWF